MAISYRDIAKLVGTSVAISINRRNGKRASTIIYDDVQTLYKGPKMHKHSIFTSLWAVRGLSLTVAKGYYNHSPEDILIYEMHSRHLSDVAREYIFDNIEAFHNVYKERGVSYIEDSLNITRVYKSLLEVNLYRCACKEDYVLPKTLTSAQKALLSYYQSEVDLDDEIPF